MKTKIMILFIIFFISIHIYAMGNINETRMLSENGKVYIDNVSGSVVVSGWEKNEVSIKGSYGSGVERIEIQSTSNNIRIKTIYKFGWKIDSKSNLEINAPIKSGLYVNTVSADIIVNDFNENAEIESVSGDINVSGNYSNLVVKSTSGNLKIEGDNDTMEVKTISGDIKLKGSMSDLDITSISGNIVLDGKILHIKSKTVSGNINYKGKEINYANLQSTSGEIYIECIPVEKADIYIETTSGNIEMNTAKNLSAKLKFESHSGNIKINGINFNKEADEEDNYIETSKFIRMTIGKGDSKIEIQSLSGDIKLYGK